jgi:hypothetical protein
MIGEEEARGFYLCLKNEARRKTNELWLKVQNWQDTRQLET